MKENPTDSFKNYERIKIPGVIELRDLSEEYLQLYVEMMEVVTENVAVTLDRDAIHGLSHEKGEDPDEFYDQWLEISAAVFYREMGDTAIPDPALNELHYNVLDAKLNVEDFDLFDVRISNAGFDAEGPHSMITGQFKVNQTTILYRIGIEYSELFETQQ